MSAWIFKAPAPLFDVFMALPEPEMRDIERPLQTVQVKQALDGSVRTHIKTTVNRHYSWAFNLTRMKALELVDVYKLYSAAKWEIEKPDFTKIIGYMTINPLTLDIIGRGVYCDSFETVIFQMEFESVQ